MKHSSGAEWLFVDGASTERLHHPHGPRVAPDRVIDGAPASSTWPTPPTSASSVARSASPGTGTATPPATRSPWRRSAFL